MMRDHLPHKIGVDVVVDAGTGHLMEHRFQNGLVMHLVAGQFLRRVEKRLTGGKRRCHIFDALFLRRDNVQGDVLQRNIGRVPQQIFGHVNSGTVMRNHLLDKTA